ncbi:MAG TPA: serine hydrolase domain-containing protein [Pirellulaceae bacterium]
MRAAKSMKCSQLLPLLAWLTFFATLSLPAAEPDFSRLETTALAEMQATNTPGAAIGIVRDGQLVWKKGLGLANVETNQPVDHEMLFRLGSTTKMFTAAAVVSLAEEGKIELNEPIGKVVPKLHPAIAALTPHQLLTHTAGLTDESVMSGRHDDDALAAYARTMDQTWLFTEPGSIHSYANPGYWLAGLVCEQRDGHPYADMMDRRLFRPLGMARTTLRPTLAMTWPLALGHEIRGGKPAIVRPQADNAATWPAGQMYSSVSDLARFTTALMDRGRLDGKPVLSPKAITALTSPHVPRPGDDEHYGYGLSVGQDRGVLIWQHGGSRTGYGSTIRMAPQQKTALIILTNRSGSSLPKTAIAALNMLLPFESLKSNNREGERRTQEGEPRPREGERRPREGEASAEPLAAKTQRQSLTPQDRADLAGTYTNNRQTIELAIDNGKLLIHRRGVDPTQTRSVSEGLSLAWSGENRLALYSGTPADNSSRPTTSFFVARDASGRPEYLITGSRALKRQEK